MQKDTTNQNESLQSRAVGNQPLEGGKSLMPPAFKVVTNEILQKEEDPKQDPGSSTGSAGKFDPLTGLYTVESADNLSSIATRFGTTLAKLQKDNPDITDPNKIFPGQAVFISDLIMPNDPTGKSSETLSFEDYVKRWETLKGRKITPSEKSTLEAGCIGITALNISMNPIKNLDECYDTFAQALKKAREINDNFRKLGKQDEQKALIFSKRFWSGGREYKPDESGKVDMNDYEDRLETGDAWRPGEGFINFDYGLYDVDSGTWWHANHAQPGMEVYKSTLDYYSRKLLDFDRQVFCVVITNQ